MTTVNTAVAAATIATTTKLIFTLVLSSHSLGVKGVVTFNDGLPASDLEIQVGTTMKVKTTSTGEYWKLLLPGQYTLNVS